MPTYEYECEQCGRTYDVWQRISAPPLTHCQHCKGPVHRLLAPAPFILKGGGWHVTDYPSESRKKAMEAEKKAPETAGSAKSSEGGTSPAGKSESPSTKSESSSPSSSGGSSPTTR